MNEKILLIDPAYYEQMLQWYNTIHITRDHLQEFELLSKKIISAKENLKTENDGKTAIIPIIGPLSRNPSMFYVLFGGAESSYSQIIEQTQKADETKQIENLKLLINSPGGNWDGLTDVIDTIAAIKKPVIAELVGAATSAAYGIASQADKIISTNDTNEIGSIGVMQRHFDYSGKMKLIRSSNAKNKNPDAFSTDGEKEIQREIDAIEDKFIGWIAEGRSAALQEKVTKQDIIKNYGQGSVFMASEGLKRNMIDEINQKPARVSNSSTIQISELTVIGFDNSAGFITSPWDKTAAERRFRRHTDSQDGPNNSGPKNKQYRNYFSWYDTENSENFAAYKLPIADVRNNNKVININAVRNALARLPQTTGIPAADQERIGATLRRYLDKFNRQRRAEKMDFNQLKTEDPELYNQMLEMGSDQERKRVVAHLKLGKSCANMDFAIKCIENGNSIQDDDVLAEYYSSKFMKKDLNDREKDNPPEFEVDDSLEDETDEDQKVKELVETVMKKSRENSN